jgi:hypothetical protein
MANLPRVGGAGYTKQNVNGKQDFGIQFLYLLLSFLIGEYFSLRCGALLGGCLRPPIYVTNAAQAPFSRRPPRLAPPLRLRPAHVKCRNALWVRQQSSRISLVFLVLCSYWLFL